MQPTSFIIEGVDRLGKSTLIENLQQTYGFFNVLHYAKPKLLGTFQTGSTEGIDARALEKYQRASFESMFKLLSSGEPFIMDRGHLGETVYANRYRSYDGNYVFDLEELSIQEYQILELESKYAIHFDEQSYPAKLILLTTSDFSFINDDGLSFDFDKKEEEQDDFIRAFNKSSLPKVMIDVSNGNGGYKHPLEILIEVLK